MKINDIRSRKGDEQVFQQLTESDLFKSIPQGLLKKHLGEVLRLNLENNEELLKIGATNSYLYIIKSGWLKVQLNKNSSSVLARFGPGACVGEISVLSDSKVTADVVADGKCELFMINRFAMWPLIEKSHQAARNLLYILSDRMRTTNRVFLEKIQKQEVLEQKAPFDTLTEMNNQKWMMTNFERHLNRAIRTHQDIALLLINVDFLRLYNEEFGHIGGDLALKTIALVIGKNLRPSSLAARRDGDEFAVLLPDTTEPEAEIVAQRIRVAVSKAKIRMDDRRIRSTPTVSIGISRFQGASDNLQKLLERATAALGRAKSGKRNKVSR